MLSFFPRGVLDEILNLIQSVSEDFPSYSLVFFFQENTGAYFSMAMMAKISVQNFKLTA